METIASPNVSPFEVGRLPDARSVSRCYLIRITLAACFGLIYLATPTADYFWDGITFALQIEKVANGAASNSLLFHQNHLLYNAIGYLIYCGSHSIGIHARALALLQVTNSLLGAAAIALFFQIAERTLRDRRIAAVASIMLAFSASWWKLATDANAYVPALVLMLLCMRNLVGPKPRWLVAGLMLAAAMLIHELASLFTLAAIVAAVSTGKIPRKTRFAVLMSGTAWSVTVAAYYACAAMFDGIVQPLAVVRWAVSNPSRFSLSLNPIPGILTTPAAIIESIVGHRFALFRSQAGFFEAGIALAAIACLVAAAATAARRVRFARLVEAIRKLNWPRLSDTPASRIAMAWLAPFLVFRCFFEPQDPYHRLFFLPAIALALGLFAARYGLIRSNRGPSRGIHPPSPVSLAVASLALFNMVFFILPNMKSSSNKLVESARLAPAVWNERTLIYFAGRNEADTTFEYFNDRTSWRRLSPTRLTTLNEDVASICGQGGAIWLNSGAASMVDPVWLNEHASGEEIRVEAAYAAARYVRLKP